MDSLLRLGRVSQSGTVLVPQSVVHGVLLDGGFEVELSLVEVSSDELDDAEGVQNLSVGGFELVGLDVSDFYSVQVKISLALNHRQPTEVRMIPKPRGEIPHSLHLLKLVGRTDAKRQQAVEVIRICLVGVLQCYDGKFVLIVLLVQET